MITINHLGEPFITRSSGPRLLLCANALLFRTYNVYIFMSERYLKGRAQSTNSEHSLYYQGIEGVGKGTHLKETHTTNKFQFAVLLNIGILIT